MAKKRFMAAIYAGERALYEGEGATLVAAILAAEEAQSDPDDGEGDKRWMAWEGERECADEEICEALAIAHDH